MEHKVAMYFWSGAFYIIMEFVCSYRVICTEMLKVQLQVLGYNAMLEGGEAEPLFGRSLWLNVMSEHKSFLKEPLHIIY